MAIDLKDKDYSAGQIQKSVWDQESNRLRVDAKVTATIGELAVDLDASEDSVRIGDGTNLATVTSTGALNVAIQDIDVLFDYNLISVNVGDTATIISKTFTSDKRIKSALLSGENLGKYVIYLNGQELASLRTTWLNFNLIVPLHNLKVTSGDLLEIKITNNNTSIANFNGTLFYERISE